MAPNGSDSEAIPYPDSPLRHLLVVAGSILQDPQRTVTALLGLFLLFFGVGVLLLQLATGWLVVSAAVPIALVCGSIALHLAAHWDGGS
jgi:hypothetical protein